MQVKTILLEVFKTIYLPKKSFWWLEVDTAGGVWLDHHEEGHCQTEWLLWMNTNWFAKQIQNTLYFTTKVLDLSYEPRKIKYKNSFYYWSLTGVQGISAY